MDWFTVAVFSVPVISALAGLFVSIAREKAEPSQVSDEARRWAAKHFAEPLRLIAAVVFEVFKEAKFDGVSIHELRPDTRFVEDLDWQWCSLEPAELLIDLEQKLGFEIPDEACAVCNIHELVLSIHQFIETRRT